MNLAKRTHGLTSCSLAGVSLSFHAFMMLSMNFEFPLDYITSPLAAFC